MKNDFCVVELVEKDNLPVPYGIIALSGLISLKHITLQFYPNILFSTLYQFAESSFEAALSFSVS